jgi:hypothetical protein
MREKIKNLITDLNNRIKYDEGAIRDPSQSDDHDWLRTRKKAWRFVVHELESIISEDKEQRL